MHFISKYKSQVTPKEIQILSHLHFSDGYMWGAFLDEPGFVILCKIKKEIIGWAFIFQSDERDIYRKSFFVFVRGDYRRMGIGKKLYEIAKEKFGNLWCSRHDLTSTQFFESLKYTNED